MEQNRNVACEWAYAPPLDAATGEPAPVSRYGAPCETSDLLELDRARGWMRASVVDPAGGFSSQKVFAGLRSVDYPGVTRAVAV